MLSKHAIIVRVVVCCLAIYLGFIFIEQTWNEYAFEMESRYLAANLLFLTLIFSIIYFWGQQSRISIFVFWTVCLLMGIADYFIVEFKGQPVVPADVLALGTALEVSSGYTYTPSDQMIDNICLYLFASALLVFIPDIKISKKGFAGCTALALVLTLGMCTYMTDGDIEDDFDCVVGEWNTLWYYENQGTTLCFLKRVQDLFPEAPDNYSPSVAKSLLAGSEGIQAELTQDSAAQNELPNIIVVMNESFADISKLPLIESQDAQLTEFYRIAESSIVSGTAYASCFGAGTCNSEFEVLTGSSMAYLGENVYPYVLYDLACNENLVTYLESFGYETLAMHPADAQNWRRDRVYRSLGFDEFLDITNFDGAEKFRWYTLDSETYDKSIEVIEGSDAPQFILDITIQNHGGYDSGMVSEELTPRITANGQSYLEVSEYAACAQQSDLELAAFIEQLSAMEEKVVVLFFGDHQPSLGNIPTEEIYGKTTADMTLDELQQMYEVPYLIWSNFETEGNTGNKLNTSLNYLGANLIQAAGLPLSSYLQFIAAAQQALPAINYNGYMSSDGVWHSYATTEEETAEDQNETMAIALQTMQDYAIVQFANLFDAPSCADSLIL